MAAEPSPSWEELGRRRDELRRLECETSRALMGMHLRHGADPGRRTCEGCVHLVKANGDTAHGGYLKCELWGSTRGPGTDWRLKWPACGAFEGPPPPPWTEKRAMGAKWWRYYRGDELLGALRYVGRYGTRIRTPNAGGFDVGYVDYEGVWLLKVPSAAEPAVFFSAKTAEAALAEHVAELDGRARDVTEADETAGG